MNLDDARRAIGLGVATGDARWTELAAHEAELRSAVLNSLAVRADSAACVITIDPAPLTWDRKFDDVRFELHVACPVAPTTLTLHENLVRRRPELPRLLLGRGRAIVQRRRAARERALGYVPRPPVPSGRDRVRVHQGRRQPHLDRARPHPVPVRAAPAGGARARRRRLATAPRPRGRDTRDAQGRDRVHARALDHALPGVLRRDPPAVPRDRGRNRGLGLRRRLEQPAPVPAGPGVDHGVRLRPSTAWASPARWRTSRCRRSARARARRLQCRRRARADGDRARHPPLLYLASRRSWYPRLVMGLGSLLIAWSR